MIEDPAELLAHYDELPAARALHAALDGADFDVYLVGGAVRDLMLSRPPAELDLLVDGELAPVAARLGGELRDYGRFGTATLRHDSFVYDLARPRREGYARPGALPDVMPATPREDLGRRDFTVNAMALGAHGPSRGVWLADPRAEDDLREGRLRVLHAASFRDDPTRLFRLARYAGRLGFAVDPETLDLAHQAVAEGALGTVSGSRLGAELRLIADEADPAAAFAALARLGLDAALARGFGVRDPELIGRGLELLPSEADRGGLALAAAGLATAPGELERLLERLAFSAASRTRVVAAARAAPVLAAALAEAEGPSSILAAVGDARAETVALAGALGPAAAARRWLSELCSVRLEIDGRDLIEAGVAPGPAVGRGLRAALAAKLDGRAPGREAELAAALRAALA